MAELGVKPEHFWVCPYPPKKTRICQHVYPFILMGRCHPSVPSPPFIYFLFIFAIPSGAHGLFLAQESLVAGSGPVWMMGIKPRVLGKHAPLCYRSGPVHTLILRGRRVLLKGVRTIPKDPRKCPLPGHLQRSSTPHTWDHSAGAGGHQVASNAGDRDATEPRVDRDGHLQ